MEKECFCCKQTKPISEFYKHAMMADGRLNKCKSCVKQSVKERRFNPESRERVLAYDRKRGNRQSKLYLKKYRARYPNKYRAHNLVNNAIRDKRLFREPCEVCGRTDTVEGHHDDYAKPLNVRWLCAAHNRQWHSDNGEALNP
jgi:hypothetical protein